MNNIIPKTKGVFMNYFQKMFMLTVLAVGVYVPEAISDESIQNKIHNAIEKRINELNKTSSRKDGDIIKLLDIIKADITEILNSTSDTTEYNDLKEALEKLDTRNLFAMLGHIRIILANIHPNTKELILKQVSPKYKPFIS
jgi:hypothetical protein